MTSVANAFWLRLCRAVLSVVKNKEEIVGLLGERIAIVTSLNFRDTVWGKGFSRSESPFSPVLSTASDLEAYWMILRGL